ncbi:MAG: galactose-1-phosphate uridylyltransferase, partial [Planctomycetota bacterium]
LWIHTAPFATAGASASAEDSLGFHWHLESAPRTTGPAGFETGGGDYIISISPEDAADYLRLDR